MSYRDRLNRYGTPSRDAESRVYIYWQAPESLTSATGIAHRDTYAARDIEQLTQLIEDLREYRQALAARYAELQVMSYSDTLQLVRSPHWKGHIEYIITISRRYSDGTTVDQLREVFPGKDRHAAFKRFDEIRKQRPGIAIVKDLEKKCWE